MPRPKLNRDQETDLATALGNDALDRGHAIAPQIYERIRLAIILSNLPSGSLLIESDLAAHFSVSRTPVREAYIRLSADGLIETRPQVGSVVAPKDDDRVREGAIIRRALESEVVVALAHSGVSLTSLRPTLALQKLAVEDGDVVAFFNADEFFHAELATLAGIPSAWRLAQSVKSHTDRARIELMSGIETRIRVAYDEHLALVELIEQGDVDAARAAIGVHINSVFDIVGAPLHSNSKQAS